MRKKERYFEISKYWATYHSLTLLEKIYPKPCSDNIKKEFKEYGNKSCKLRSQKQSYRRRASNKNVQIGWCRAIHRNHICGKMEIKVTETQMLKIYSLPPSTQRGTTIS